MNTPTVDANWPEGDMVNRTHEDMRVTRIEHISWRAMRSVACRAMVVSTMVNVVVLQGGAKVPYLRFAALGKYKAKVVLSDPSTSCTIRESPTPQTCCPSCATAIHQIVVNTVQDESLAQSMAPADHGIDEGHKLPHSRAMLRRYTTGNRQCDLFATGTSNRGGPTA